MYPTCGEQQQEEIKTIRKRKLELELSDADVKRISQKAGAVGLTVAELLQNFIGDLVCGTYSNGSDERMYAEQWFDRCGFSFFPDFTFLRYLVEWGGVDEVITLWEDILEAKEEIAHLTQHPEEAEPDEIAGYQEDIEYWQEQLNDFWNEYTKQTKEYTPGTLEEEMNKVLQWRESYQAFLGSEEAGKGMYSP